MAPLITKKAEGQLGVMKTICPCFQAAEMLQGLKKSSEFSKMHAIKEGHQCGKTITHWF